MIYETVIKDFFFFITEKKNFSKERKKLILELKYV